MGKQKLTLWSYHHFVGLGRLLLYNKGQVDLVWENIGKGLDKLIEILYFYIHSMNPGVCHKDGRMWNKSQIRKNIQIYIVKCCD